MEQERTKPPTGRALRRAVVASVIGNGLEWYDFVSYGYFSAIIARVFFPTHSAASLMLTYATFAVGFVVQPIGGIVLGAYADRHGRRRVLALLIAMMAVGTLTIGLTPSYAAIGFASPLIVVLGRIVQGISIGGEFSNATALLVEYVPESQRMTFGSFQQSAQAVGRVCATGIGVLVLSVFPAPVVHDWAWRLPFLIGALVGPFGFYIRYRLAESPEYRHLAEHAGDIARTPVRAVLRDHTLALVCGIGLVASGTALTYIWNSYLTIYVIRQLHLPLWEDLFGVAVTSTLAIFLCPLGGWMADRWGAYRLFFTLTAISALIAYPLFDYLLAAPSFTRLFAVQFVALTVFALKIGSSPGMLAALFPVEVRSTGLAIAYNVSVTAFGGFAPLTVTWLIAATGDRTMPAFYLMATAALSIVIVAATIGGVRRRVRLAVPVSA
jgi:MHS family proline/betaine transporter-like MFS transporter